MEKLWMQRNVSGRVCWLKSQSLPCCKIPSRRQPSAEWLVSDGISKRGIHTLLQKAAARTSWRLCCGRSKSLVTLWLLLSSPLAKHLFHYTLEDAVQSVKTRTLQNKNLSYSPNLKELRPSGMPDQAILNVYIKGEKTYFAFVLTHFSLLTLVLWYTRAKIINLHTRIFWSEAVKNCDLWKSICNKVWFATRVML